MAAIDRRVRIRPRDGASSLYYGNGLAGAVSATGFRQNQLAQPANGQTLPWLSSGQGQTLPWTVNRPAAAQSPNTPNVLQQPATPSFTDAFNISAITSIIPGLSSNPVSSSINLFNNLGVASGGVPGGVNGAVPGLPWLQSAAQNINSTNGAGGNILEPLGLTNGMIFPYTPTIDYQQTVDYTSYDPTHTNQELHSYTRTKAPIINITGKFTSQNNYESAYSLAAFHFCRTVSKMAFGQSQNPGTPPPILLFSAYGDYMYNDIPVIMTNFNVSWPDDVDYVQIPSTNTWVPTIFTMSVSLIVQNTPAILRTFNLEKFRSGQLLKNKGWT